MTDYLSTILANKKREVEQLRSFSNARPAARPASLYDAIKAPGLSVIAEIKRRSPSKGSLASIPEPRALARCYSDGGAAAISVLTDTRHFDGSDEDLQDVAAAVDLPLLRKDFIIDLRQLEQSLAIGASAVLLIVAALGQETARFCDYCRNMGLEAVVEVNNMEELSLAVDAGANLIVVNHRNLHTFQVDMTLSERLAAHIPRQLMKIAASGIATAADARRMSVLGYDAVLVGESLVGATDPTLLIRQMRGMS